jgi:hypothetical protein
MKLCKPGMRCMTLNGGCVVFRPSALSHYLGGEFHNCLLCWNIYSTHDFALKHIAVQGFILSMPISLLGEYNSCYILIISFLFFFPSLHLLMLNFGIMDLSMFSRAIDILCFEDNCASDVIVVPQVCFGHF